MSVSFVHLRLRTEYSIEDSIIQIKQLVKAAAQLHLPALGLTDRMSLSAGLKFYNAMSTAGIKPILGMDVYLNNDIVGSSPFRCTLLCQTMQGYLNLLSLVSKAYQERVANRSPVLQKRWLAHQNEGLIALSGGLKGDVAHALSVVGQQKATALLKEWQALFGDRFYIELQRMGHANEFSYITAACELASTCRVPVVATQDICFLEAQDFEAHEARICIQNGYTLSDKRRPKHYTTEQYLKSSEAMQSLFKDIPSALSNSVEIAKRCNVILDTKEVHLPNFSLPSGVAVNDYLIQEAEKGLTVRLSEIGDKEKLDTASLAVYQERLKSELQVINSMGFASYFLIVADFVRWAREATIPVGPGRGSGAGSLVAYVLRITDVDPLLYGLLFERFLNAERVSMPDFDIDFCMERRDKVINYVMDRYGRDAVAQIITFGTMAARAVIRDVGRVLGYPYGMVDSIAKLVPFEVGMTLETALKRDERSADSLKGRYKKEEEIKLLIDLARKLEGLVRNVGTHAGGVVIAPSHLTDFTALYCESGAEHMITQLDKDDLEKVGLVKFDFLGLTALTIIDWTVNAINSKRCVKGEALLNITHLPLDDKATFLLLQSANVTGVFQLESRGIRALLKRLVPDCFEDIVALIALFRPGPLQSGMVDDFIQRKHDASKIRHLHPSLESVLQPTYGVILYQEQVMKIAQILAGYSLGTADLLRVAMGKKKPAEMAKQRAVFIAGSEKNGIDKTFAKTMFDLIEKFAGYGFNRSHSVAYGLLSYQTAWLKAHYTTEFMAAVLSSEMEHIERLSDLLYECRALKLIVKPPNIYTSQYAFYVNDASEIEYGLGAIKGIGEATITHLLAVQKTSGLFQDLHDLCHRVETDKVNRRALEALICAGCLDVFKQSRAVLYAELASAMQSAAYQASDSLAKQSDLFGKVALKSEIIQHSKAQAWSLSEQLKKEKNALGIYLNAHPLTSYVNELAHLRLVKLSNANQSKPTSLLCATWLVAVRVKFTNRGDKFAILLVEDADDRQELKLSHKQYGLYKKQLVKDNFLVFELESYKDKVSQESRLVVKQLWDIAGVREKWGRALRLRLTKKLNTNQSSLLSQLEGILNTEKGGGCPVLIEYCTQAAVVPLLLEERWKVCPTDKLLESLKELLLSDNVWMEYK